MGRIGWRQAGWVRRGGYVNPALVPFQEQLPLKLRTKVSGKGEKSSTVGCIQEMSVLFACLKKNDFKEAKCATEISTFQKCYSDQMTKKRAKDEQEKKGLLVPGEKNLSHRQATELLKKFP